MRCRTFLAASIFLLGVATAGACAGGAAADDSDASDTPQESLEGDGTEDGDDIPETDEEEAEDVGSDVPFCTGQPDGTPCDDGDLCTGDDQCAGGACVPGTPRDCNDGDPCTDDSCDPAAGDCVVAANTAPCDDGDPCTVGDACADRSCVPGAPRDCSSLDDSCNTGVCAPLTGACLAEPFGDGTPCDDGDACRLGETCTGGMCGGAVAVDCSALDDQCNLGVCNATSGECEASLLPEGTTCVDGVDCTSDDRCRTGVCAGDGLDADGDGYLAVGCLAGDDCDDARWDVNPGTAEGPVGRATCFDALDNDCDTLDDGSDVACSTGLDWANLDTPLTLTVNAGSATPIIRGRAYEPGGTEAAGRMPGLIARLGWGPYRTDPTDNPAWTWVTAAYLSQGGPGNAHDVFAASLTVPTTGMFSYAFRYSLDGGTTWLYADSDGNGAAPPSNGIQLDRLGTLTVVINSHLLLTEVCVNPTLREFVEIYNPTAATLDLSTYYLTDGGDDPVGGLPWRYWDVVLGAGAIRTWDFVVRFPAGATLAAGARATVAMGSAQTFFAPYGRNPTYEICPGAPDEPTVPNMVPAWVGAACGTSGALGNSYETLILFRWDGAGDLVQDVDIFQWGSTTEALNKAGISRDGPDPGTTTSTYLADTAIASQAAFTPAPHPSTTGSFDRRDLAETGERISGGNGITGHDETSENWLTTWQTLVTATPGS